MRHAKLFAQINPPDVVDAKAQVLRMSKPSGGSLVLLSPYQAADLIGVSPSSLTRWRIAGEGPTYFQVSDRRIRYDLGDVLTYIQQRRAMIARLASK
jgi:hypothetical protein